MEARSRVSQPRQLATPPTDDLHTFGPGCRLAPVPEVQQDSWLEGIPPSNAHFFYSSIIPIDDPLSANTADPKLIKLPLRPFSQVDNNALSRAWAQLSSDKDWENHEAARCGRSPGPALVELNEDTLNIVVRNLAARHRLKHLLEDSPEQDAVTTVRATLQGAATIIPVCCEQLVADSEAELQALFCPVAVRNQATLGVDLLTQRVMVALKSAKEGKALLDPSDASEPSSLPPENTSSQTLTTQASILPIKQARQPHLPELSATTTGSVGGSSSRSGLDESTARTTKAPGAAEASVAGSLSSVPATSDLIPTTIRLTAPDDGISGKPFVRADIPSSSLKGLSPLMSLSRSLDTTNTTPIATTSTLHSEDASTCLAATTQQPQDAKSATDTSDEHTIAKTLRNEIESTTNILASKVSSAEVAVGISRLHTVSLPSLQMRPIYWSPINDISIVQRSTWFYKDTMMPLDAPVANQLEALYRELRPWSDTWQIELRCALDLGPVGEEKISQPLWPAPVQSRAKTQADRTAHAEPKISTTPYCAAHCHRGAAAASGTIVSPAAPLPDSALVAGDDKSSSASTIAPKGFANHHVVFKDGHSAFLLSPSLKPSAYYGRRPIARIFKGAAVGIPVVRGFDRHAWSRIHERHAAAKTTISKIQASAAPATNASNGSDDGLSCPSCKVDMSRNQISDLVLVIHGVGQKLAERVESFHFTHAVNGLRRAVSTELKSPVVQSVLRGGHSGIMVLPVNWRHTLTFEDGGPAETSGRAEQAGAASSFELKDIEPDSIPAVRSMISDVMFDIPFYMSHHKPKMISSLIREANRVYRLWCDNNAGFSESGRVHLIGHSLGSAMAIEVLSRQPTIVPPIPVNPAPPTANYFEFDTKNLFLLGSPAAFFLLLERGALTPRRGRLKPGVDAHDHLDDTVVGETGAFGCLAVDNIYNILAKEDPIAYLLNGTIDPTYASSLRVAYVPSTTVGLFASIGNSLRGLVSGAPPAPHLADISLSQPPAIPSFVRLPSQLELEVHDFTREEVAERKAHLLNDNGQIDYYLHSSGGPLEIQYLNMLSAHTSYWTNHDLVRMLCVEIGRRPGKAHTLPAMRAVKSLKRIVPGSSQA
ncbi:MAG: hypothetical protein SEPTF4163_002258 [Sporothrix epigloea]